MRIYSAAEAISPALARTKLLLFTPFRWGRTWKLGMTAYLSFVGTIYLPIFLVYMAAAPMVGKIAGRTAEWLVITAALCVTVLYTIVFVLCSRLQFAFFDITLNRGEFVALAWRKYGGIAGRWTWIKIGVGVLAVLLVAAPAITVARGMIGAFEHLAAITKDLQPGAPMPPEMFSIMAAFYGAYFGFLLLIGIYYLAVTTFSAFMVPSMALESMTPRAAMQRFFQFVKLETSEFFVFVLIRLGIGLVAYFAGAFAYEFVLLFLVAIIGLVFFLIGLLLHAVGVSVGVLIAIAAIVGIPAFIALNFYIMGLVMGSVFTFFEAHTLYFLGGRYPMLGALLEQSTPPPLAWPPAPTFADPPAPPPVPTPYTPPSS